MHPSLSDYGSTVPIDYESLRNEIVTGTDYVPSFGMKLQLEQQFDMLEKEFAGQLRLKLVHAELNVLLRRGIAPEAAYAHFERLWAEHGDILLETLDSRWLISACDTICDYSADPADAQVAILLSLFANTLKLVETERFMSVSSVSDPERVMKRIPLFDGLTAFMVGNGDMVKNLLRRLDVTLRDDTSVGMIGRELIGRSLSSNTVFDRLAQFQHHNHWQTDLTPTPKPKRRIVEPIISDPEGHGPGYILLNDTARLSGNYHLGTVYACKNLRQNLASRGLREIGWANDRDRWENLMSRSEQAPDLVVLNGEGTLHHGAPRAEELLLLCQVSDVSANGTI